MPFRTFQPIRMRPNSNFRGVVGCLFLITFSLAGCKHRDLVEAELRYQSNRVEELENEVLLRDAEINTLKVTVDGLRQEVEKRGTSVPPETIYRNIGLSKITLGTLTGGKDLDGDGKDDGLLVQIICHDHDGDTFKCPGNVSLQAMAVDKSGKKTQAGEWEISDETLRKGWRAGILGQGFQLILKFREPAQTRDLAIHASFRTLDGRVFSADRDVSISNKTDPNAREVVLNELTPPIISPAVPGTNPVEPDPPIKLGQVLGAQIPLKR